MSRKCKCKICNKELTTDKAYKITRINNKTNKKTNMYYCSKEEYNNYIKDKEDKMDCIDYIVDLLKLDFNLPVLKKELKEIEDDIVQCWEFLNNDTNSPTKFLTPEKPDGSKYANYEDALRNSWIDYYEDRYPDKIVGL